MLEGKTYWLIGASEGLGRALAQELDAAGASLVLSARSTDRLEALAADLSHPARIIGCDVCQPDMVEAACSAVSAMQGGVDGIVYLAALYEPMEAAGWQPETAERMADVGFMGAMRILGRIVPAFAARGSGHIVLIGSLAGYRGLPGTIGYGAAKAGLMHLGEQLQADLEGSGVVVQLLNPGFIRTRLTDKNEFTMPFLMTPERAAAIVRKAMQSARRRQDFPWIFSLVFRASRFLPYWLYARIFHKHK